MLTSSISNTEWCHSVGESCNFMDSYVLIFGLAGVIANGFLGNLMLFVPDVIAMLPLGFATLILCEEEYIGESARTFAERFKEHQKSPSPTHDHCNTSGHKVTINNFIIIGREDQNLTRVIKEALFIRVNDPSLNRNIGKYHLPYIWDEVLHKTAELKLKH